MTDYWYPKATKQTWAAYPGSPMNTNCVVLHSTEGTGWPAYSSGAVAPNMTIMPDFRNKTVIVKQHVASNRSARALENRAGGVSTNTAGAFQIELVGTCDPRSHKAWGTTNHIYMPEAPDWFLKGVADVLVWLKTQHPKFQIKDGAPRGWGAYPSSYGASKYRMSFSEWNANYAIVGHQHVPENSHGDPGNINIKRIVELALGAAAHPDPTPTPPVYDKMDPTAYFMGVQGDHVTWLGERLIAHGFDKHHTGDKYIPGPTFSEIDRLNVQDFQKSRGWEGSDADGYPGAASLKILSLDPVEVKPPVVVPPVPAKSIRIRTVDMNVAGYNDHGQKTYKSRVDAFGKKMVDLNPDIITVQELSNLLKARMRPRLDAILKKDGILRAGGSDGRYVYYNSKTVKKIATGYYTAAKTSWFKRDDKQAAWLVYSKNGVKAMEISLHLENEDGADAKRIQQLSSFVHQTLTTAKKYGVAQKNISINGDTNSDNMARQFMESLGWVDSSRTADVRENEEFKTHNSWGTIKRGAHIDYLFVKKGVRVTLWKQYPRKDWSDHHMIVQDRHITA